MTEKHRGDVKFVYPDGLFKNVHEIHSIQLFQLYEQEIRSETFSEFYCSDDNGYSILYGLHGNGILRINDCKYSLSPYTLILIPNTQYSVEASDESLPLTYICLEFSISSQISSNELMSLYSLISHGKRVLCANNTKVLLPIFTDFIGELCLSHPSKLLIQGMLEQVLVAAHRCLIDKSETLSIDTHSSNVVGHTVYAIVKYVDDHLYSIHNLSDMAKELGYSYNYLSHLFRRKTGTTIQSYVSRKKIEKSTELLSNAHYSVTEIAALLNYDCIQSFSKAFKKAMGVSPTEYRESKGLYTIEDS